jgi:hypothetical protein
MSAGVLAVLGTGGPYRTEVYISDNRQTGHDGTFPRGEWMIREVQDDLLPKMLNFDTLGTLKGRDSLERTL